MKKLEYHRLLFLYTGPRTRISKKQFVVDVRGLHRLVCVYSIHVLGWLQKWLNLITAPGSVSNEPGSVTWLATKYLKTVSWKKSHWKINHIVTTEYIILAENQHSIFIFHYFNAKLLGKYSQTPVWHLCDSCQILDLINFKTTWLDLPTLLESV